MLHFFFLIAAAFAAVDFTQVDTLGSQFNVGNVGYAYEANLQLIGEDGWLYVPNNFGYVNQSIAGFIDVYDRSRTFIQTISSSLSTDIYSFDVDGDTLVLADWDQYVTVFRRSSGIWAEVQTIDTRTLFSNAGLGCPAAAVEGNTLALGLPDYSVNFGNDGIVVIYTRASGTADFTFSQNVDHPSIGPDPDQCGGEYFGVDVIFQDGELFVGATCESNNGANSSEGAVFVFNSNFDHLQTIPGPGNSGSGSAGYFGYAVSHVNKYLAVGAPYTADFNGSVVVYQRNGPSSAPWQEVDRIAFPGSVAVDGYEAFGASVATWDEIVVVAAPARDTGTSTSEGAVYIFQRNGATFELIQTLTGNPANNNGYFGALVDMHRRGNMYTLAVTEPFENTNGNFYVYESPAPAAGASSPSADLTSAVF